MISNSKISNIIKNIALNYKPDKIILYGSYATGTATEDSDLDFIIIKNTDTPKQKRGREIRRYLLGSFVPMDIKVYTPNEFNNESQIDYSFLSSAIKESKVVYEKED